MAKNKLLAFNPKDITKKAMENIEDEIVTERIGMVRDYIKGVYWYRNEIENNIKNLQKQIDEINNALKLAESGEFDDVKKIKVPAKFLSEKTVRMNDMDWEE